MNESVSVSSVGVARASRVVVAASRRNRLFASAWSNELSLTAEVRDRETRSPAHETLALPGPAILRGLGDQFCLFFNF